MSANPSLAATAPKAGCAAAQVASATLPMVTRQRGSSPQPRGVRVLVRLDKEVVVRRIGWGPGEASHQFRTELLGQQASKQIRLFIRCLSADDAGNGTSAVLLFHPPQRINHPAERLLPGHRGEIRLSTGREGGGELLGRSLAGVAPGKRAGEQRGHTEAAAALAACWVSRPETR